MKNLMDRIKSALEHHGCLSGDCPHEKQVECFYAVVEFFIQFEVEVLADIDVYGLTKYYPLDISRRNLQAHKDRFKDGLADHAYYSVDEVKAFLMVKQMFPNNDSTVDVIKKEANEWKRQHDFAVTARFAAEKEVEKLRKEIEELKLQVPTNSSKDGCFQQWVPREVVAYAHSSEVDSIFAGDDIFTALMKDHKSLKSQEAHKSEKVEALKWELHVVKSYGNKDCLAQAYEVLERRPYKKGVNDVPTSQL